MKILLISNIFPPGFIGGYELAAEEVAVYIAQAGHKVTVLTSDYFYGDTNLPLSYDRGLQCVGIDHALPKSSDAHYKINIINYYNIRAISRSIEKLTPDLIICFNLAGLGPVGIVKFLEDAGIPTIFYFMDTPFAGIDREGCGWKTIEQVLGPLRLNAGSSAIFMSDVVEKEVEPYFNCENAKSIFPGWVDTSFKSDGDYHSCRNKENASFVFCSRISVHKGIDVIVDAIRIGREEGLDYRVDIYGAGDVSTLGRTCRMAGVDHLISYRGTLNKSDVVPTLSRYKALLFPTVQREPFGFIVAEGALAGCVPIMTSGIGASNWFINGEDCFKIPRHSRALFQAMRNFNSLSDAVVKRMAKRAQTVALNYLSKDLWLKRILDKVDEECSSHVRVIDPRLKASYLYLAEVCHV